MFEAVLGSQVGKRLWHYAVRVKFKEGEIISKQGEINHTLYVLQTGKVSSYRFSESENLLTRQHTMSRGAFMNSECLFLNLPVTASTIADEDSVVWAITRAKFIAMEAHEPQVALEVMRAVLKHTHTVAERLENEVLAIEAVPSVSSVRTRTGTAPVDSEGIGSMEQRLAVKVGGAVMRSIRAAADETKSEVEECGLGMGLGELYSHHFHHITVRTLQTRNKNRRLQELSNGPNITPHLSRNQVISKP